METLIDEVQDLAGQLARLSERVSSVQHEDLVHLAASVEELARRAEYLQLVTADAFVSAWKTGRVQGASDFRSGAEHLGAIARIERGNARRRCENAAALLPRVSMSGEEIPAIHSTLACAFAGGLLGERALTTAVRALEETSFMATADQQREVERSLTDAGIHHDAGFVRAVGKRWLAFLDQDGPEPEVEELAARQGVFARGLWRGLYRFDVHATQEQYEALLTTMNAATNPRVRLSAEQAGADPSLEIDPGQGPVLATATDKRTRAQRMLDGLVGACLSALRATDVPDAGGNPSVVLVTIPLEQLQKATGRGCEAPSLMSGGAGGGEPIPGSASFGFTGPVRLSAVRRMLCDSAIVPVTLGGKSQVLDVGRSARTFTVAMRRGLAARDGGCAFPGCTMPAAWCEAHHVTYWSRGGPTSMDNGVLLCSHHHHVIHQESWRVEMVSGVPWFIPPPYVDPARRALRNSYFSPLAA